MSRQTTTAGADAQRTKAELEAAPDATQWRRGRYVVDTDLARMDLPSVREFLASSYWAGDIPLSVVEKACSGSVCFGLFLEKDVDVSPEQVGFARVITDRATFGYLADVYVLEEHRRRGLAGWLVECVFAHSELRDFRRWMLATRDAHDLYARYGFEPLADPTKFMEIARPGLYTEAAVRGAR